MNVPALRTLALAAALAAALSACESPSKISQPSTPAVETRTPLAAAPATTAPAATVSTNPTPAQSTVAAVDLATPRAATAGAGAAGSTALMAAPTERIVYFDFDSFAIKDEYKSLLDAHAKVLARTAGKRIVVEGHTDERGGREYNLALGQKRAESVVRSLALLGVTDKQMEAVSFGEERPAVQGADESAWARNRRAELKDK